MTQARSRIRGVSRALGSVPSLVYAGAYLFMIPGFAWVYANMQHEFFHGTIRAEQVLNSDAAHIMQVLQKQIAEVFRKNNKTDEKSIGEWTIDIDELEVTSFDLAGERFAFVFSVPFLSKALRNGEPTLDAPRQFNAKATSSLRYVPASGTEDDLYYNYNRRPLVLEELTDVDGLRVFNSTNRLNAAARVIFPSSELWDATAHGGALELNDEIRELLERYAAGLNGMASDLDGNFSRMLYLSAVTITTLGFGDIVPVTNRARILVAAEAVLGIVIIGLFLNALAYERSEARVGPENT